MSELFVDWDVTMRRAENWIALLPIGEQPDTALRSEVELLVKNGLLGPVYAQAAADWLAWAAAASRDAEAVLAQALVRETELGLVTALVTLEVHVYREGSNGCPTVLELVEAASLPGEEDLSNREVTTVELQSGQAVRARWRREGGRNGDVSTAIDTVCYWLPLPSRQATATMTGMSAELLYGDQLASTYDLLAGSIQVVDLSPATP